MSTCDPPVAYPRPERRTSLSTCYGGVHRVQVDSAGRGGSTQFVSDALPSRSIFAGLTGRPRDWPVLSSTSRRWPNCRLRRGLPVHRSLRSPGGTRRSFEHQFLCNRRTHPETMIMIGGGHRSVLWRARNLAERWLGVGGNAGSAWTLLICWAKTRMDIYHSPNQAGPNHAECPTRRAFFALE